MSFTARRSTALPMQTPSQLPAATRIPGLDLARAFAILGMVVVNFHLTLASGAEDPAWLLALVTSVQGRAAATFVVLAGLGASLMSRAARASGDAAERARVRRALLRRALFLGLVGTAFLVIWPADILHFYGVWMLVGAALLFAPSGLIAMVAMGVVGAGAAYFVLGDYFAHWDLMTLEYRDLHRPARFLENLFLNGFHPVLPWLALYLGGMLLGRLDLASRATRLRILAVAAPVAAAVHLVEDALVPPILLELRPVHLLGTGSLPPTPGFVVACGALAASFIALCIELAPRLPGWVRTPLEHAGQLALTIYIAHVVVGLGALEEMGRLGGQTLTFAAGASITFVAAAILAATLWRRRFRRGPIEALMRRLSPA